MPRPGRGGMSLEKSKDFKGAILRLLKSLSPWKVIMIFALVLAMTGAIVSLIAPHKLSEFADLIRVGLMGQDIDMKAIKELAILMGVCAFAGGTAGGGQRLFREPGTRKCYWMFHRCRYDHRESPFKKPFITMRSI